MDRFELQRRQKALQRQAERHAQPTHAVEPKRIVVESPSTTKAGALPLGALREAEDSASSRAAHEARAAKRAAHRNAAQTRNDFRQDATRAASDSAGAKLRQDMDNAASTPLKPYEAE